MKNLDPSSTVLEKHYDEIEKDIFGTAYDVRDIDHLDELMQISPYGDFEGFIAS